MCRKFAQIGWDLGGVVPSGPVSVVLRDPRQAGRQAGIQDQGTRVARSSIKSATVPELLARVLVDGDLAVSRVSSDRALSVRTQKRGRRGRMQDDGQRRAGDRVSS